MASRVPQDLAVPQGNLGHPAFLAALEPRVTRVCKALRDPKVCKDHEVRLANPAPLASVALKAVPAKTVFPARRALRDPRATLALLASLVLEVPQASPAALAFLATRGSGVWEDHEASREILG